MIRYYTANMAGPYHLDNGIPCQNSFYIKRDNNGVVYASAADGLGSESNSDDGSRIASQKSCDYCMEHYMSGMPFSEVKKIMNNAFVNAYKAVLEEAHTAGNSPDEYDTTLCMVIFDDGHVFYGQSGDSGIIALMKSGEYVPLTTQQRDEDGYVFPLCSGPSMWVFGEVEAPVSSVMLMTDGVWEQICPPLLRNHDVKINVTLASRFMDRHETSLRSILVGCWTMIKPLWLSIIRFSRLRKCPQNIIRLLIGCHCRKQLKPIFMLMMTLLTKRSKAVKKSWLNIPAKILTLLCRKISWIKETAASL